MDWEDVNKAALIDMIRMWLIKSELGIKPEHYAQILHVAYFINKRKLPMDLKAALREFVEWQTESGKQPEWLQSDMGTGIP